MESDIRLQGLLRVLIKKGIITLPEVSEAVGYCKNIHNMHGRDNLHMSDMLKDIPTVSDLEDPKYNDKITFKAYFGSKELKHMLPIKCGSCGHIFMKDVYMDCCSNPVLVVQYMKRHQTIDMG